MENKGQLKVYNSISREKEVFEPIQAPFVGMYVCGPTVYSEAHLGNIMTFTKFDVIYRYLKVLGYKVRYVRNITDAGHMEDDSDWGEDKMSKRARLEKIDPMEVVQKYTVGFHNTMQKMNALPPSIEPTATGHIIEQINMVKQLLENGYAYEANGSVYFDTPKFAKDFPYGKLSGKKQEDLLVETRDLNKQSEKKSPQDFLLWGKAEEKHLQKWKSPWSLGFPGWHLECSAMSHKYLGEYFDIHGGGMDLKFPHHENEIAQTVGCFKGNSVKYWLHTNMLTMNHERMSKTKGNNILPEELFTGNNTLLEKAFHPMVVRFFMMQSHYRSTLDFSNDALIASEKGFKRLSTAIESLEKLEHPKNEVAKNETEEKYVLETIAEVWEHMNDDFGTPQVIAKMFDLSSKVNSFVNKQIPLDSIRLETFNTLKSTMNTFFFDVLGLDMMNDSDDKTLDGLMNVLINIRKNARTNKDFSTSDLIRDELKSAGIELNDGKEGTTWNKI